MAILKSSKSGTSYDTETGIRTNIDGTTTQVNNGTITPEILKGSTSKLEIPDTSTTYNQNLSGAINGVIANNKIDQTDYAKTQSQTDDIYSKLMGVNTEEANVNQTVDRTAENEARKQADKYTSQIEQLQKSTRDNIESLRKNNPQGMSTGALNTTINDIERESLSKQADLALLQSASIRDYSTLNSIAEQQVQNNLAQIKAKKENLQLFISKLDKTEQRQYDAIQKQVDREYETKEKNENLIAQLKTNVAQYAGSNATNLLNQLSLIDTSDSKAYDKAIKIAGKYTTDPLERAIKQAQYDNLKAKTIETPTIKTINGVDMQWDSTNGKWVTPSSDEKIDQTKLQNSLDNLKFLKKTADSAIKKSGASGISGAGKFIGDLFVGDTKYRQLESLTNTLKVNVLSLMTDPSIKKFFGPQMSNADVELMTSAGTTLNPEKQSPEMLKSEIGRLTDLFDRMETSIKDNATNIYLDTIDKTLTTNSAYGSYLQVER